MIVLVPEHGSIVIVTVKKTKAFLSHSFNNDIKLDA